MFEALLSNALAHLTVAEEMVGVLESYATSKNTDQEKRVKQYAVAACVMRVYGVYERFIEAAIADYLDSIPEVIAFSDLPDGVKSEYRQGISHVLSRLEHARYSHLNHENVIRWYHDALSGLPNYRFVTEALTRHEQNLRLNTVVSLVSRVGVNPLHEWLVRCPFITQLYEDDSRLLERLEAELKEFIDVRNDAAHGVLETLQAPNILLRHIAVVRAVITSVATCLRSAIVERKLQAKMLYPLGQVTEVLPKAHCVILQLEAGGQIAVGDLLYFHARSFCTEQRVRSLRVDNVDVQSFISLSHATEIGIGLESLPRENVVALGVVAV